MDKKIDFWNELRVVPEAAQKKIEGGKLRGMTDVNPVWRMQIMNNTFGMCGFGWKYEVIKQWFEQYGDEVEAFCNINLYVKVDGQWSEAIPGTGGSSFVATTRNGSEVSNEAFKMALTDALSVAMKAIGVAADVYFAKGANYGTKYEQGDAAPAKAKEEPKKAEPKKEEPKKEEPKTDVQPTSEELAAKLLEMTPEIMAAKNKKELVRIWWKYESMQTYQPFKELMGKRKGEVAA